MGTSGGSIVAALYASGLDAVELENLFLEPLGRGGLNPGDDRNQELFFQKIRGTQSFPEKDSPLLSIPFG